MSRVSKSSAADFGRPEAAQTHQRPCVPPHVVFAAPYRCRVVSISSVEEMNGTSRGGPHPGRRIRPFRLGAIGKRFFKLRGPSVANGSERI